MKDLDPLDISSDVLKRMKRGAFLTVKAGDALNTMTIGWGQIGFIWQRPVFMVAVRDSRHTFGIIEQAQDFSVTFPSTNMKDALRFCGSKSGREFDKFKECNLVAAPSQQIVSPIVQTPGTHLECKICLKTPMDATLMNPALEDLYPAKDYHTLYYGEIVACYEL